MQPEPGSGWFAVRCVFRLGTQEPQETGHRYEERITLWRADNAEDAIARAESEARAYATSGDDEYLGLAQSYALSDPPDRDGAEVYSLIRDSELDPERYLDTYFDTGREHQQLLD